MVEGDMAADMAANMAANMAADMAADMAVNMAVNMAADMGKKAVLVKKQLPTHFANHLLKKVNVCLQLIVLVQFVIHLIMEDHHHHHHHMAVNQITKKIGVMNKLAKMKKNVNL